MSASIGQFLHLGKTKEATANFLIAHWKEQTMEFLLSVLLSHLKPPYVLVLGKLQLAGQAHL